MKILMIQRAERFSPNSVEKDKAILEAVAEQLQKKNYEVNIVSESMLPSELKCYDVIFTMSREPETLKHLKTLHANIINSPAGIENCARCELEQLMEQLGVPQAPKEGHHGYWLKRGDAAAQSEKDVVYAPDKAALNKAVDLMKKRGIHNYLISAHVKGDLVKFYGVEGTSFFRYYYPTDDGLTKYGDERLNGQAHHYSFDIETLQKDVNRLALAVGIKVFGGDCIIRKDGSYCIIDFNDWPSFFRCKEEAAKAIASII